MTSKKTNKETSPKHGLSKAEKIAIPIIIIIAVWAVYSFTQPSPSSTTLQVTYSSTGSLSQLSSAPDFTLPIVGSSGLTGNTLTLSSFAGRLCSLSSWNHGAHIVNTWPRSWMACTHNMVAATSSSFQWQDLGMEQRQTTQPTSFEITEPVGRIFTIPQVPYSVTTEYNRRPPSSLSERTEPSHPRSLANKHQTHCQVPSRRQ